MKTIMLWWVLLFVLLLAGRVGLADPPQPHGTLYLPLIVLSGSKLDQRADGALPLVPAEGASDQNPAFSPDGRQLVFTRFDEGYNDGPAGLFVLEMESGQLQRLTPQEDQDNVNLPGSAWSAVHDRIVLSSDRNESDDLWQIAPDGSDFRRLTTHTSPPFYIEPSWSADGQWIVFEARQPDAQAEDGSRGRIWKVRVDGSDLSPLNGDCVSSSSAIAEECDDRQPNWSPLGDRILFQRRIVPEGQWDIYTMAVDGSDVFNVTTDPEASDTDAAWSPDGRYIVYSSDHGGLPAPNLFAIPSDGGEAMRITRDPNHEDSAPSWSPDGQWLAFESHLFEEEERPASLWRVQVPSALLSP